MFSTTSSTNTSTYLSMSVDEAFDCLEQVVEEHGVIPVGHEETLTATTHHLREACEQFEITTLDQAIKSSGHLIADFATVERSALTQFHDQKTADAIHLARNTFAAAVAAGAFMNNVDPDDVIKALAKVCMRGAETRALEDDEIVVLRILILRDLKHGARRSISGARYVMTDAGLYPSEATMTTPADMDFDGGRVPTLVRAPGVKVRAHARHIELDDFAQGCLAKIVAGHLSRHRHAGTSPIGYTGTHPSGGYFASASASTGLKNLFARAGLDENLKPLAILQWRVRHTVLKDGIEAALALSGKTSKLAVGELAQMQIEAKRKRRNRISGFLDDAA